MSDQLKAELAMLNKAVQDAIAKRKQWMDAHMPDFARYAIGEELFLIPEGIPIGAVCGYFRINQGHYEFDTTMHVEYSLRVTEGIIDNTARMMHNYGNREELKRALLSRASAL